jgi:hypothetical protein
MEWTPEEGFVFPERASSALLSIEYMQVQREADESN